MYDLPFQEEPAASEAVAETMNGVDWKQLLSKVDESFCSWRVPTAVLYGNQVRAEHLVKLCGSRNRDCPIHKPEKNVKLCVQGTPDGTTRACRTPFWTCGTP